MLPEHLITGPSHYNLQGSVRMHKNSMKQGGNSNQMQPSKGKKNTCKVLVCTYLWLIQSNSEHVLRTNHIKACIIVSGSEPGSGGG